MLTPPNHRKSRYSPAVVTKNELIELLNDDFTRECRAVYAHAVFAERLKGRDAATAAEVTRRGRESVLASLALCQIIYDYGGTVAHDLDELNAVLNADRVAEPEWAAETLRRLSNRVGQLRAAGEPGLAKRMRRIIAAKRGTAPLCDLVARV
jgi:ferritin-like protein